MTIHAEHPFLEPTRDPGRQFRGRLGGRVSVWTAGAGMQRAGLTVSSLILVPGEQWTALACLDPDADLTAQLQRTGTGVISLLDAPHRGLAEIFAGLAPAPGGPFACGAWQETAWGPALTDSEHLAGVHTWAGVRLVRHRQVGYQLVVACRIEHIELGEDADPLLTYRGRYSTDTG